MKPLIFGIICLALYGSLCFPVDCEEILPGKLIERLACKKDPEFSYSLYLPTSYSVEKKSPVIFCFDPRARGEIPVQRFMHAAETNGYIVVGSLDARNGPAQPVIDASNAVWNDVRERFSIDDKRVYAAGFSGGAEMAAMFPSNILQRIAGIICCGAALPPNYNPAGLSQTLYFGIMGRKDFLFPNMAKLGPILDEHKVRYRIMYFKGWHQWPPEPLLKEAVVWLELISMQKGIKARDSEFVQNIMRDRLLHAEQMKKNRRWVESYLSYVGIIDDFGDLTDITAIKAELFSLSQSKEYQEQTQVVEKIANMEASHIKRVQSIFSALEKTVSKNLTLTGVTRELRLDTLIRSGEDSNNFLEQEMSQRLLSLILLKADRGGLQAVQSRDYPRAIIFFQMAKKASIYHPIHSNMLYKLAGVFSLWNKKKEALKHLKQAIDAGFQAADVMAEDPDLENIRSEPEFQNLLNKLKLKTLLSVSSFGILILIEDVLFDSNFNNQYPLKSEWIYYEFSLFIYLLGG